MDNTYIQVKLKQIRSNKELSRNSKYKLKYEYTDLNVDNDFKGFKSASLYFNNDNIFNYLYNLSEEDFNNTNIDLFYTVSSGTLEYYKLSISNQLGIETFNIN